MEQGGGVSGELAGVEEEGGAGGVMRSLTMGFFSTGVSRDHGAGQVGSVVTETQRIVLQRVGSTLPQLVVQISRSSLLQILSYTSFTTFKIQESLINAFPL